MAQVSENVGCRMLGEFREDADRACREPKCLDEGSKIEGTKELLRRIANEMAVPQFNLGEVVQKVLAFVGSQIEEHLEQSDNEQLRKALDHLKLKPSSLVRILFKITARALKDGPVRELFRDLLIIHPNGKSIAAAYGDIREVERIMQQADEQSDELCLNQLELYAKQIVAQYERELNEAKQVNSEESASRENDIC